MNKLIFILAFFCASFARADEEIYVPNLPGYVTGTNLGGGHIGMDISGTISATNPSVGTNNASAPTSSTELGIIDGTGKLQGVSATNPVPITGTISASNPSVSATGAAVPASATFLGGQNGSGNLVGLLTGQQTMANSLACVLPSNQSSIPVTGSGNFTVVQSTGTNLHAVLDAGSAIVGKVGIDQTTPGTTNGVQVNAALPAGANIIGKVSIDQTTPGTTNGVQVNAALPAGGNTIGAVTQASGPWTQNITQVGSASITLGSKTSANSYPVVIASDQGGISTKSPVNANATLSARQTVTTSESNLSAPANAVSVIVECESVNADNLRWGFSNAGTAILSSTLGMLCEPGRSDNIPVGAGTILHMIATGGGSDFMDVQWVLSQ